MVIIPAHQRPAMSGELLRSLLVHSIVPFALALPVPLVAMLTAQLCGAPFGCLVVGTLISLAAGLVGAGIGSAVLPLGGTAAGFALGSVVGRLGGTCIGTGIGVALCSGLTVLTTMGPLCAWQRALGPITMLRAWDRELARHGPLEAEAPSDAPVVSRQPS